MRTGMSEFWRKSRWLILWGTLCTCLLGYSLYAWLTFPTFPQCKANVHLAYDFGGKRVELEQSFSTVDSGWRETTLLVNGRVNDGQEHFNISRTLVFHYSYSDGLFHMRLKEAVKGETDNVAREELANLVPPRWDSSYLRVEKMGASKYLLTNNQAVLLVCTAL